MKALRAQTGSPRFYEVAAVAALLGLSKWTLYRVIRAGQFPAIRVGARYVVPAQAIDQMEQQALQSGSLVDSATWVTEANLT
jgi:excisionase family DNA binding protein